MHDTERLPGATVRARKLRDDETEAEYRLRGELRGRRLNGYKFVRQIPIGPYIADFVCREANLIIEVDGGQHAESSKDDERTTWLNNQGYSVLRFWNHEILRERRAVLDTILAALEGRLTPEAGLRFEVPISTRKLAGFPGIISARHDQPADSEPQSIKF